MKRGFYAVKFACEIRVTSARVTGPLEAVDNVLGTRYSVPRPMVIDVLHDFGEMKVKLIARTVSELQSEKRRLAAIADASGWETPAYPPAMVERAREHLAQNLGGAR